MICQYCKTISKQVTAQYSRAEQKKCRKFAVPYCKRMEEVDGNRN